MTNSVGAREETPEVATSSVSSLCPSIPDVPVTGDSRWPENFCHHHVTIFSSHGKRMGLTCCNYCLLFLSQVHEDLCVPLQKTDSTAATGKGTCEVHKYPQSSSLFRNRACSRYEFNHV